MNNDNQKSYTAKPGDTMWSISRMFNIPISELIQSNPSIKDPNRLHPGDLINVPSGNIQLPCCVILRPIRELPPDSIGAALIRRLVELRPGRTAISVLAHGLPNPQELGNFNAYQALAFIPGVITWQWVLEPTSEAFPTWAGTFNEITAQLTPNTVIQVRPISTQIENRGEPILSGTLEAC